MMVKLYYYTTKSVYEGILTEEFIMQPDASQSMKDRKCDRGIYLTTLGPQNFEGLTLIPKKNKKIAGNFDYYFEVDIPIEDPRLIKLPIENADSYRYVGDIDFDEFEWTSGQCSQSGGADIQCGDCGGEKQEESESSEAEESETSDDSDEEPKDFLSEVPEEMREEARSFNRKLNDDEFGSDRRTMIEMLKVGSEDYPLPLEDVFSLLDIAGDGTVPADELK